MYISVEQAQELDKIVKSNEVALRSFISEVIVSKHGNKDSFKSSLENIAISDELIYSKRFSAKLKTFIRDFEKIFNILLECNASLISKSYNNDVPYVSEIVDLLLIFFNSYFHDRNLTKDFGSVEEFHYCCTLYHQVRNNLSHPASRPITKADASKVIYFMKNLASSLDSKYYWYRSKGMIENDISRYIDINVGNQPKYINLSSAKSTHKNLICRDNIINDLYECLLGSNVRNRLAGSVVLYGYGGVGKTAITTEFLYRVLRDKADGKFEDLEFLLFYSSKDEYLRENKTTGELYIDTEKPEFSTLEELQKLICKSLCFSEVGEIARTNLKGIIAIDNIENIGNIEKNKIIDYIKSLPRSIQFIITSRNEEQCEEKIHIKEFGSDEIGYQFVSSLIESEGFNIGIDREGILEILQASKGNALIILQVLNILSRDVSTFDQVVKSLFSMRSKNTEMIANFMYKNTFDSALKYLDDSGYPVIKVLQVISLYDERIELYSISRLTKTEISDAERLCNYLLERLILNKTGEYYELNEFAKRFVFIKLLPDRFELSNLKENIRQHKERMNQKLTQLDSTFGKNSALHQNVTEWQPRNYIDKIVIAELFSLYGDAIKCVHRNDKKSYESYIKEFNNHSFITNHPYVALQKARLLKEGISKFYRNDESYLDLIEKSYEEAIESIEYDYMYLIGTVAHASLLMLFGIFLLQNRKDHSRSIRFLEDAKKYFQNKKDKTWFITRNYLAMAYESKYKQVKDNAYSDQLIKVVKEVIDNEKSVGRKSFNIPKFKQRFSKWISQ
tara:strand:+ start:97 stop:2469 length:2373 start_codon:yes stop_codon:yes gene_type:complete